MKSELYPGINFEHTLDDVLFVEYDQFLSEDYYVNIPYLLENLDILITSLAEISSAETESANSKLSPIFNTSKG